MNLNIQGGVFYAGIFRQVVYFFYLFFILIIVSYNIMYLSRVLHTSRKLGMHVPKKFSHLVRTSIALAILTSVCIVIFLVVGL